MIRPKQFARIGEFHLEEAILDVLLEEHHEKDCIGPAEISRRAGIFRRGGGGGDLPAGMNDAICNGMLIKLYEEGKVKRCEKVSGSGQGWKLTKEEFERRRDDVGSG